ncbi:uncharacterized protein LOC112083144 isoform X2 [Eutrema salsugineum]|uniref:uncharacterized protein LOC112083144 isoform X2 n=1 Tax=Eutrema salsugineum TaxID=72664 RepID=UPI000CED4BC5|nr:uncharacterized protein LOC112083144 isoform X2 [Eutrema salsugineum]
MDAFVIVIIIVCAGIVFPALVLCCVLTHRGKKPLKSQPRDLEMSKIGIKDGGLVVLTRNVSASAAVAAAVVMMVEEMVEAVVEVAVAVEVKGFLIDML